LAADRDLLARLDRFVGLGRLVPYRAELLVDRAALHVDLQTHRPQRVASAVASLTETEGIGTPGGPLATVSVTTPLAEASPGRRPILLMT
jgi:hypothetical protein